LSKPDIKELRKKLDVEGLIRALTYSDWHVRRDAISVLGKIADKNEVSPLLRKSIEPLIKALRDENAEVRKAAADSFGSFAIYRVVDEITVKPLEEALKVSLEDDDKNVVFAAASTLGILPISVTLQEGERPVKHLEDVDIEGFPYSIGYLLLTNRRLIFSGVRVAGSFSYELPLDYVASCEVKKSMFGKEKLEVVSRQAVFRQRLQLETGFHEGRTTISWKEIGTSILKEPKPAVFTGIKQPEILKKEIMELLKS
jgi:hypothetical protein